MEVFGPLLPLLHGRAPQRSNVPSRRAIGPVFGRSPKAISPPHRLLRPLQPNRSSANRFPDPSAPAGGSAIAPLRLPPPCHLHASAPTDPPPQDRRGASGSDPPVGCWWGWRCLLGRVDESAGVGFLKEVPSCTNPILLWRCLFQIHSPVFPKLYLVF